jgi:hypothetical protein
MVRSLFYISKELNSNIFLYLRYTLFIPLYPIGVLAEIYLVITQLSSIKEQRPFSVFMPNDFNISFDSYYFTFIFLFGYFYGKREICNSKRLKHFHCSTSTC